MTSATVLPEVETKSRNFCKHCGVYNSKPGQCVGCYKNIGSLRVALVAGFISTLLYGVLWIALTMVLRIQIPLVAAAYGAAVSFAISHYSRGRGILFQIIATTCTYFGIVFSDTLAFLLIRHSEGFVNIWGYNLDNWIWVFKNGLLYEDSTMIFTVLGILSGFWLWRYAIPNED